MPTEQILALLIAERDKLSRAAKPQVKAASKSKKTAKAE
jgi:hypothetical protein